MRKLFFAFCGVALLGAAPAFAADSPQCVRRNDIRAWASPARRVLIVENYAHNKVLLKMSGTCLGFGPDDSFRIMGPLESPAGCIVAGDVVSTHWAGEPGRCIVNSVTPYTGPLHPPGAHHTVL